MSHRSLTIMAVAALTALTLGGGGSALAARQAGATAGQSARSDGSAAGRTTALARPSQRVLLITGDVVLMSARAGGPRTTSVDRARTRGPGAEYQMFTENGDQYVVPESAVPFLGSALSLSLFDVTRLAKQEHGAMSLAVRLRLRPGGRRAVLPGITLSQRSAPVATARLTLASARRFGAALARQASSYHTAPAQHAGLFAGVASIAPATTGRPASASAGHLARTATATDTLTVHGINAAGAADNGDIVFIYNVDNLNTYTNALTFQNGIATFQLPPGHYEALCYFSLASPIAVAINPQFTVAGTKSITLDARKATAPVSVSTPRPATAAINQLGFGRTDALGNLQPYSYIGNQQTSFTVQPFTGTVTAGKLYYYFYTRLFSPATARTQYSYDLQFPSSGTVPANEHYTVTASNLGSVRSSYPATHSAQSALDARFGALPWEADVMTTTIPLTTPLTRTEYYTASPGVLWSGLYYAVDLTASQTFLGQLSSTWTRYRAGQSSRTVWGAQPEQPRLLETDQYPHHAYCPACLAGSTLDLLAFPFSDNSPSHYGFPDSTPPPGGTESESSDVFADGTEIAQGGFLQQSVALPTGTKHVRIDYNTARSSSDFTLSTSADTTWTVKTSEPRTALPPGWYCSSSNDTNCTVLPLMSADYHLPLNMLGQLSPGPVSAGVSLSHLAGANIAVSSLSVKVSFDGGTTWTPATVTSQGSGRYAVAFTVPAQAQTNGFGAIKLAATDADGGTLSQTISQAFAVAAS